MFLNFLLIKFFATTDATTKDEIINICRSCLEEDTGGNLQKYTQLVPILGPLQIIFQKEKEKGKLNIPFDKLLAGFINEPLAQYVELLTDPQCIISAKTFVDAFLRNKIPLPIPEKIQSGAAAHGTMIGYGRFPFFVHDLFHTQEMINRAMPYQRQLSILFNKILSTCPADKKNIIYHLLAMYIHEVMPDEKTYKDAKTVQDVINKFYDYLERRLVKEINKESDHDHFTKELALCSWVYEIAERNTLYELGGEFTWEQFIKEVKELANDKPYTLDNISINDDGSATVFGLKTLTLSKGQRRSLMLEDSLNELKELGLIGQDISIDSPDVIQKISAGSKKVIDYAKGITLTFTPDEQQELLSITQIEPERRRRSLLPIEGCLLETVRNNLQQTDTRNTSHSDMKQLSQIAHSKAQHFLQTITDEQKETTREQRDKREAEGQDEASMEPFNVSLVRNFSNEQLSVCSTILCDWLRELGYSDIVGILPKTGYLLQRWAYTLLDYAGRIFDRINPNELMARICQELSWELPQKPDTPRRNFYQETPENLKKIFRQMVTIYNYEILKKPKAKL